MINNSACYSYSYSELVIGWILVSLPLTIAFLPHDNLPVRIRPMSSLSSSSSAVDASLDATEDSGSDQSRTYRYASPFSPSGSSRPRIPSALIILNTPIRSSNEGGRLSGVLGALWEASSYRVCADGGANRLHDATVAVRGIGSESDDESHADYLPDMITGDLDSLRPDVHRYYEARGVSILRVEDQNFHDLDKSLMAVEKWVGTMSSSERNHDEKLNASSSAFIYGGFGGRFDQEMGCVNALFVWGKKDTFQQTTLALYDEETCAFALPGLPMKSEIRIRFPGESIESDEQTNKVGEGPTCGLIPIGGRCDNVRTTGLKWNLEGDIALEFGGLVSSSNRVIDEMVTVQASSPLLFTAEMIVKPSIIC